MCCSLLLVVGDVLVNKEVDKLSSSIRILPQLITVIKEIIASAKHWFFFCCSHYTPCHLNLRSVWCHFQWIWILNVYVGLKKMCRPSSAALCRLLKRKFAIIISHLSLRPQKCCLTSTQADLTNLSFLLITHDSRILFHLTWRSRDLTSFGTMPPSFWDINCGLIHPPLKATELGGISVKNERPLHTIQHRHVCIESKEPTEEVRCCCMTTVTWQPAVKKIWTITEGLLELGTSCFIK